MKQYISLMLLAAAIATTACVDSSDDNLYIDSSQTQNQATTREISLTVSAGNQTRMSVSPDSSNDLWSVTWSDDDLAGGWCNSSGGSLTQFTMVEIDSNDSDLATFTGTGVVGKDMRLLYPYDAQALSGGDYTIDISTQEVDLGESKYDLYGCQNLYMISDIFCVTADDSTPDITPTMSHLLTTIEMVVTPTNMAATSRLEKVIINGLDAICEVDFDDATLGSVQSGAIRLDIANSPELTDEQSISIPFSAIPFTTQSDIEVLLYMSDGEVYSVTKSAPATAITFEAGTHNTLSIEVDGTTSQATTYTLAQISASSYPTEDRWIITDTSASTSQFAGVSAAIAQISTNDPTRRITLDLVNLESIPDYMIFGESDESTTFASSCLEAISADKATSVGSYALYYCTQLEGIELPNAITIGSKAFNNCSSITSLSLPSATTIGTFAFSYCSALSSLDLPAITTISSSSFYYCQTLSSIRLATNSGVVLSSISSSALYNVTTSSISLWIGASNASLVSGNTLTVGSSSFEFKSITLL